jgi:hypothetical protein
MTIKIILEVLATLILANIFGVLYDYTFSLRQPFTERKIYLFSKRGIVKSLFTRTISIILFYIPNFITLRNSRYLRVFFEVSIFALSIFTLIHLMTFNVDIMIFDFIKYQFLYYLFLSFIIWSFTYAWISITSNYFYLGKNENELSNLELKILYSSATFYDKIKVFTLNILLSLIHWFILFLAAITVGYVYLVSYLINLL